MDGQWLLGWLFGWSIGLLVVWFAGHLLDGIGLVVWMFGLVGQNLGCLIGWQLNPNSLWPGTQGALEVWPRWEASVAECQALRSPTRTSTCSPPPGLNFWDKRCCQHFDHFSPPPGCSSPPPASRPWAVCPGTSWTTPLPPTPPPTPAWWATPPWACRNRSPRRIFPPPSPLLSHLVEEEVVNSLGAVSSPSRSSSPTQVALIPWVEEPIYLPVCQTNPISELVR